MGYCVGEIAVWGPPNYFSFMGCANGPLCRRNSCMGAPKLFFPLWGVLMGHCVGKIAVWGPPSYFSFMGYANGPPCRQNICMRPWSKKYATHISASLNWDHSSARDDVGWPGVARGDVGWLEVMVGDMGIFGVMRLDTVQTSYHLRLRR
jgi:hypothetical protein